MTDKDDKWVKKGLFWTESPEEKSRVRSEGKKLLIIALVLGILGVSAYYILSSLGLELVGAYLLKLFGIIVFVFFGLGIWQFVTGNEPPANP